jgi:hypothetical protein
MRWEDLNRILLAEKRLEPSSAFARAVMTRVQREAALGPEVSFPWVAFAAVILILTALALCFYPAASIWRAANLASNVIANWMVTPPNAVMRKALLPAFASLAGTLLLAWFSFRLAGTNR